jgi:peptidoglycan/LPS O-acetylase OafA/YrhL
MKTGTSLYLDGVRFAAALTVFIEHLREHTRNGFGGFWRSHPFLYSHLTAYSQLAVTVFFVLSGYVIAHVLAMRETTPLEYAASRLARLYSVVVPALVLTALCNYLMELRYPDAFQLFESGGPGRVALSFVGTALFVNRFWLWPNLEPPNTPFWTLSFEATYYVTVAVLVFVKGRGRILGMLALCLAAGPSMVLLAPTWFLGYVAYYAAGRWRLSARLGMPLWLASLLVLPLCASLELQFREPLSFLRTTDQAVGVLLAAYAASFCFAVNVFCFNTFSGPAEGLLMPVSRLIRWFGSMTFALYLFHQPLLSLFTVYHLSDRSSVGQLALLVGGTFLVVATLGRFCENTKGAYKRWLLAAWQRLASPGAVLGGGPTMPTTLDSQAHAAARRRPPGLMNR